MNQNSSLFQSNIIYTIILRTVLCFTLLRSSHTRNIFQDLELNSQTLNPVVTGFMLTGNAANDQFGISVSTAGDINNDGYDDIIVGAYFKNSQQGAAYLIYGGEESSFLNIDLSTQTLDPLTTGFMMTGSAASDQFGISVSRAGDIDGDGYDDIIVGAPNKNGNQGAAYVIYGGDKSTMSNWDFSSGVTLTPSTTGFMIIGKTAGDTFGYSVSTVGDINNDGYDDIIIGAPNRSGGQGAAYVIYGGQKATRSNIYLSTQTLDPLTTGFTITGNASPNVLGQAVSAAGDINNDGYDDIIIGAYGVSSNQGAAYVIYGGEKLAMSNWDFNSGVTLTPSTTGFMITGNAAGDMLGFSVSAAGDIDKDGYDDIIVGAPFKNSNQGTAYVIYGGDKSIMDDIDLSLELLDPQTTGFMITGNAAGGVFGWSVHSAGDINKDGYDEIIIGAYGVSGSQGAAYVIYGGAKSSRSNIALSSQTLSPLATGFMITGNAGGDGFGYSVSTAGDTNNDGYDDIIIGARGKSSARGGAYLIYASCSANCKQCFSESICAECKNSYLMYQERCYDSCPDTTLATSSTTCEDCPTRCKHCSSTSLCTECISPFVLYDTQCLASCPITMFNSNNVCKSCPSYCSSCISQDSCQVCFEGYTLSNSSCVLPSSESSPQQKALKATSSATQGLSSVVCIGSSMVPFSALVSKIVQNTRYLNLSVTNELAEVYETWNTDLISWDIPNIFSNADHFESSPLLFAEYSLGSPFLVNFWPTFINIAIGFGTFAVCILLKKLLEHEKYEGWAYSLVLKLLAGSFNFALVQTYACLDDILLYLVLDAKTNPFNSFFSWTSMICAALFFVLGCFQVFFNFWTVKKYQSIKNQGTKEIEAFNEKNKYWELFYSDFNNDDFWSQSFFAIVIARSVLSNFIISVLYDYPLMQTSYFLMMDTAIISFLYFQNPLNTLRGTLAQYYYEIITLLVHICAFIMAFQDSLDNPSDTVRQIMSTGILYLNSALISGAVGFMFIEIYKTISKKKRIKKRKNVPEDTQETQNLTQTVRPFHPNAQNRQDSIENFDYFFPKTNQRRNPDFTNNDSNTNELDTYPSQRINQQRNQGKRSIRTRQRQRGNRFAFPRHATNNESSPNH